jgi:hypothetical protein
MSELMLPRTLLAAGPDDADWSDVLGRVTRARRRRRALAVAALAAAITVGVASAYALGHPIIDFNKAPKGTKKIVNDFGSMEVGAPPGMAPGVLPHQARRITSVRIDGKAHVLYVAPTTQGGFCEQWSHFFGGCRASRHDRSAREIGLTFLNATKNRGIAVLGGSFLQSRGERLEISYADGVTAEIPFVWVTGPIDAGFFLYRVPDAHRVRAARPTAITLFDGDGKVIIRQGVIDVAAGERPEVGHRVRGYPPLSVPANAEWAKRQQLFALRADDGARIGLWIAPERGGGVCYWTNQALGCTRVGHRFFGAPAPLALGFQGGGKHVTLCCIVGAHVVRVEARFEDGDRVELTPRRGYLIWPIPSRHYALGHRLNQLLAYDGSGRPIARRPERTNDPGLYPCKKPKRYGYGVFRCP